MSPSIYYINPLADFPTYFNSENYHARGLRQATQIADLAIPTLAALTPNDFRIQLCDQNISPIDFDLDVDYVGITGKITQYHHMVATAQEFRKRGKTVIIGGPYASLSPEVLRPHCDILIKGEIEDIAPEIFADLRAKTWKSEYQGNKPDMSRSPVPRWDLYPNDRAAMGTLQTSRGCPFECEFCDVIQYLGRQQRHKNPPQVVKELDMLYQHGYRSIFLADDNFTVYRSRAKELLCAIRDWNRAQTRGKASFLTQVSIDAARDDELLTLCAEAGVTTVFIGIETPNEESLREAKKRQNLRIDLTAEISRFLAHGIYVVGGMIVGFDADGPDIFRRQYDFAMQTGIPIYSLGALAAPAATPLYARLAEAGRLKTGGSEVAAVPWTTNIVHPTMKDEELIGGLRWLPKNLYLPQSFRDRLLLFIEKLGPRRDPKWQTAGGTDAVRSVDRDSMDIIYKLKSLGPAEAAMWTRVMTACARKPEALPFVLISCLQYMQIRYMYDLGQFWDAQLSAAPAPAARPATDLVTLGVRKRDVVPGGAA